MKATSNLQIGKQGVTDNFIETLKNHFKKHETVKISVLKSYTRDKNKIKKHSEEIVDKLGRNYVCRLIGFTIVLRKMRKNVR